MTTQSDRPGGDGLREKLVAFSDFLNEPPQYEELRMVRDYRHEACAKWLPLVTDLIARFAASLPTRDAAEGAGALASALEKCDWSGVSIGNKALIKNAIETLHAAPPKPAPDAMRFAVLSPSVIAQAYRDWAWMKKGEAVGNMLAHEAARCAFAAGAEWAALAAPVPPADVQAKFYAVLSKSIPQEMIDDIWQDIKEAGVFAVPVPPADGTERRWLNDLIKAAEAFRIAMVVSGALNKVGQGNYVNQLRDLEAALNPFNYRSPSPAVAAEPNYADGEAPWSEDEQFSEQAKACRSRRNQYGKNHCSEKDGTCSECEYDAQKVLRKKYPAAATPPVRGEAADIARSIDTIERCYDFRCPTGPLKNCGEWKYLKRLLSLPVQYGAGEPDLIFASARPSIR